MEFTAIMAPHGGGAGGGEDSERGGGAAAAGAAAAAWAVVEKEHMFEKHAERYFPLDAAATSGGKGLVLSFEDRTGKAWRFRYSYWNSSQSYVMTKGWSRFVKEKRLGAGDTVLFGRGLGEAARGRLFIDFRRRRQDAGSTAFVFPPTAALHHQRLELPSVPLCPWREPRERDYGTYVYGSIPASSRHVLFLRPQVPATAVVLKSVPVRVAASAVEATRPKRVRLFGVNLDSPSMDDDGGEDIARSATRTRASPLLHLPSPSSSTSSSTAGKETCSLDLGL
ncbi:hypothetical protein GUJ93_ZPchr0012g20154 [Zizania palustris]|uniref:TF-B3 domain-containing protein n=1 Tax=Zizania palustris TaxID=103762 RepID=A0A8J6BSX3_ZIZPA|nr:hypothetical protein GUJ93_ZPchr0012g20154 [Zizania palustris]